MSMPYDKSPEVIQKANMISNDGDLQKIRPISAAVVRGPNVRIKDNVKDKREYKIWNLDEQIKKIDNDAKDDYCDKHNDVKEETKGEL